MCKGRHNTSVCFKSKRGCSTGSVSASHVEDSHTVSPTPHVTGLNPETLPFEPPHATNAFLVNDTSAILFQTAQAIVFNLEQPERRMQVHVLLDSGSQCSYITEGACERLALRSLGCKSVSILTFGSRQDQSTHCEIVKLGLELENSLHMELKLLVVPHICEPIANATVALDNYPHLKSLAFATDLEQPSQIRPDILLGCDQYWSLLMGEMVKSESGPVAIKTHQGWILSGPAMVKEAAVQRATLVTYVLRVDGVNKNRRLEKESNSLWNLESIGIVETHESVQTQFDSHIAFEGGRYVASLP